MAQIYAYRVLGRGCVVRAGAVVDQRSHFDTETEIDGRPAVAIRRGSRSTEFSPRASQRDDLPDPTATGPIR
jgi:carbonic anhydrase/acetyltransferase-like protein (isoleucine patch superfamily)